MTSNSVVRACGQSMEAEIQGESVILQVGTGVYFGVNEVGTRVWQLLKSPQRFGALVQQLTQEFDVAQQQLEADLVRFINQLQSAGLVEVGEEGA